MVALHSLCSTTAEVCRLPSVHSNVGFLFRLAALPNTVLVTGIECSYHSSSSSSKLLHESGAIIAPKKFVNHIDFFRAIFAAGTLLVSYPRMA